MAYDVQLKKKKINARIFYDVKIGSEMNGNVAEWSALFQYFDSFMSNDSKSLVHCVETQWIFFVSNEYNTYEVALALRCIQQKKEKKSSTISQFIFFRFYIFCQI